MYPFITDFRIFICAGLASLYSGEESIFSLVVCQSS